jgi:hypothetical protein
MPDSLTTIAASRPTKRRLSCRLKVEVSLSGPAKAEAMFSRITARLSRSEPVMMAVASSV